MSKKKTTQQQASQQSFNNTNSYGWMEQPETKDIQAVRDFKFTADPSIGYAFGNAKNQVANSFNNPLGGYYSPQIKDSVLRSSLSDLAQNEAQAHSVANQQLQGAQYGQRALLAGMTAPRMVQTGASGTGQSSGSGTSVYSPSFLDTIGQISQIGSTAAS